MSTTTDPIAAWKEAVQAKVNQGMDRREAASAVAKENPALREAYVAAYNRAHNPRKRIQ